MLQDQALMKMNFADRRQKLEFALFQHSIHQLISFKFLLSPNWQLPAQSPQ